MNTWKTMKMWSHLNLCIDHFGVKHFICYWDDFGVIIGDNDIVKAYVFFWIPILYV